MDIAVIGGGVSGMIAAICAAGQGADVTIFEHMPRIGKKLLLTGSGKCNLSNTDMDISHFHGGDKGVIEAVLGACDDKATRSFFEKLGIYFRDKGGYLYPYCEQASAVLDVLRFTIRDMGIDVHTGTDIKMIDKISMSQDRETEDRFVVITSEGKLSFDRVIICTGSAANRNTGSDGTGYSLAKSFGHSLVKPLPALTYLVCDEGFYPSIAGIRTMATVSLYAGKGDEEIRLLGEEYGQVQFTKTGISGICVFNLSHLAVAAMDAGREVRAAIDFLPDISKDMIRDHIKNRIDNNPQRPVEELFAGLFAKPLGILIAKRCSLDLKKRCDMITSSKIVDLCRMIKGFETLVISYGDTENCQVMQGGVRLSEVKDTLESRLVSGLYFAGEILDVHGDCGGYNLQWAASSGMLAGRSCITC
ncbi:MAG: aminoacetone oxidase family FAD-binding enzyme [Lachnospiraceae bacterium]|nr:aminoacetone oxidase family FAD-binding enzyme [Lachnospiraceae bacterium]